MRVACSGLGTSVVSIIFGSPVVATKCNVRGTKDLPREIQQNIEKIGVSGSGRLIPQLYSKLQASQELRRMLEIGRSDDTNAIQRLSDAELVAQLSDQAKQLGVEINLNYSFIQERGLAPVDCPKNAKLSHSHRHFDASDACGGRRDREDK
jgi:hypothetical protein